MGRKSRARAQAEMAIGKIELRDLRQKVLLNERFYEESCLCCVLESMHEQKQNKIIATLNKIVNNDEKAADTRSVAESEASFSSKNNDEEKALKRKLKKERQKEKKNCAKQTTVKATHKKIKNSDENDSETCEPEIPITTTTLTLATDIQEQKSEPLASNNDDNSESENNDDNDTGNGDDVDFSVDAPVVSAFVQSMINSKRNTIKMMKKPNDADRIKDTNLMSDRTIIADNVDGFTNVKKGTKQAPVKFNKTPEGFGIEALRMVRVNNFPLAINYLTRAINLDSMDSRHYINRSYCYLRLGRYADALTDIKFASEHLTNVTDLAKAKCREGQAYCGLQNYEEAEVAFRHCLELTPDCPYIKRELKRTQVCQMVNMGFKEREAILVLQEHPNTMDAIISLSSKMTTNQGSCDSVEIATDDEIYESDEEEELSNESLLSTMLNYHPNLLEERATGTIAPKVPRPRNNSSKAETAERELRVIKTIHPVIKPDPTVNEMAIWVGNITPFVTDNMLTKGFARFSKVTSIWRSPTGTYCFINFQTATGAKKALEEANISGGNINVNGHLLLLKQATPKSLKNCH